MFFVGWLGILCVKIKNIGKNPTQSVDDGVQ